MEDLKLLNDFRPGDTYALYYVVEKGGELNIKNLEFVIEFPKREWTGWMEQNGVKTEMKLDEFLVA